MKTKGFWALASILITVVLVTLSLGDSDINTQASGMTSNELSQIALLSFDLKTPREADVSERTLNSDDQIQLAACCKICRKGKARA